MVGQNIQKGGGERTIPLYKDEKNNPFLTNEQREINRDKIIEKYGIPQNDELYDKLKKESQIEFDQRMQEKQLVNLQIFQPQKQPDPRYMDTGTFMPLTAPTPFFPPQFGYNYAIPPYMYGSGAQQMRTPIINYTIHAGGPNADHGILEKVYEDVIPNTEMRVTGNTITERMALHSYIRSTLFSNGDGNNISLTGGSNGVESLLSKIKFMELNPYSSYRFSNNPYAGLPNDFLIYRSCYPIRSEPSNAKVSCAANSLGLAVRVYNMTEVEFNINSTPSTVLTGSTGTMGITSIPGATGTFVSNKKENYDVWRESMYYNYVKEHIIKPKLCPSFVTMYGYYLVRNSNIDFNRIRTLSGLSSLIHQQKYINEPPTIDSTMPASTPGVTGYIAPSILPSRMIPNPLYNKGKAKVIVTEAPNNNLYGWASKTYSTTGHTKTMISSGYHSEPAWFSVLFQILVGLYIMKKHNMAFTEFKPDGNIFIKELNLNKNATTYWKYKINGIDYYIPNYGFLAVIDSSYEELTDKSKGNRIKSKIFGDDEKEVDSMCYETFKNTFTPDLFGPLFMRHGGVQPETNVLRLLTTMKDDIATRERTSPGNKDMEYYIREYMDRYMHNRIGTYVREPELGNIRPDEKTFARGQIIVHQEEKDVYKFVLYLEDRVGGRAVIMTKNDPLKKDEKKITRVVSKTYLMCYAKTEPIYQEFKIDDALLNEEDLLETYIIN